MRHNINKAICIISLILIQENWGECGQQATRMQERMRLIHADSLVSISQNDSEVTELIGHVKLVQGEAFLHCTKARWWQKENKAILTGNVEIYDGKRTLWSDRVDYDGRTKIEKAMGNVRLENGEQRLTARELEYSQEEESAAAHGDVIITDLVEMVTIEGDRAFYDQLRDYGLVEGMPQMTRTDTASGEKMVVRGLKIEAWGDEQRIVVTDSVQIDKGNLRAVCLKADYMAQADSLILDETPIVWHRDHEMRGDHIDILLDGVDFHGGIIRGNAEIISKDSTTEDLLEGAEIFVEVHRDTIRKVVVEGQARSVYHVFEEDDRERREQGTNTVTGDRLILMFKDEQLDRVLVESDPAQSTGTYIPERPRQESVETGKKM